MDTPAFLLLFHRRCPHTLSQRQPGTLAPASHQRAGTELSCTIRHVSLVLTLSLWLNSASPPHRATSGSHTALAVSVVAHQCHPLSPRQPACLVPACRAASSPGGAAWPPFPARQDSTRSWGISSIPIVLLPAAPLLCSPGGSRGQVGGWPRPRPTSSSSAHPGPKQGDSSCLSPGAGQGLAATITVFSSSFCLTASSRRPATIPLHQQSWPRG